MMRAHDKKIRPRQFQEGELVLKRIPQNRQDPRGKWSPNWEGSYVVKKAFSKKSLDTCENGWERVLQSYKFRYSQEVLCLR